MITGFYAGGNISSTNISGGCQSRSLKNLFKFLDSSNNYEYFNAIIRRRVSLLLDHGDYVKIAKDDIDSFEQFLLDSRYAESYRSQLVRTRRSTLSRIEFAIANQLSRELNHSRKIAKGEVYDLLDVILARSDLYNTRLVIRSLFTGTFGGKEPIWQDFGAIPMGFFSDLWWEGKTPEKILEKCHSQGHPMALALASSVSDFQQGYDLHHAERKLLIKHIEYLNDSLSSTNSSSAKVIKDYLGMNIDLWNVGIWTRANSKAGKFVKKEPDYIPGGLSFSVSELNEARILGVLIRGSRWSGALGIMEKDRHGNIQRAMQIQMLNWQKKLYRSNPLGIEVALGYVAMYLIEWENLNLLAVGLASRMNSEDLLKRIISV